MYMSCSHNAHLTSTARLFPAALSDLHLLLANGTNVNSRTGILLRAPLHVAAERGRHEVASLILSAGCDVSLEDANGWNALHVAAAGRTAAHCDTAMLLLRAGVRPDATTNRGQTALHTAINFVLDKPRA
jgi:ankyrin repeat protein